jgi:hypothetical protein
MRCGALTAPHSSVIHPRLYQPFDFGIARMKRRYENQTATAAQPSLCGSGRMEG